MTRKLTDQSEDEETVIDAGYDDMTGLKDDQDEAEAAILAQFDADEDNIEWTASIYEVGTGGEKDGWLFDCSMGDILGVRQKLLDVYGTGLYRARIRRANRLARFLTYRIVAPRLGPQVQPQMIEGPNPLVIAVQDQGRLLEALVSKLGETPPVAVQNNPMEMMQVMATMMSTMREFMPGTQAPAMDPLQLFELFKTGFEMASDRGGDGETNILDLVKELIKSPMLKELAAPPQLAAPQIPGPKKTVPAQPPQSTQAAPVDQTKPSETVAPVQEGEVATPLTNDPVVLGVIGYIKGFVEKAERNADPGLYTDFIIDNVELEVIAHVVGTPNISEILKASDPGISNHWPWFEAVLSQLQDAVAEEAQYKAEDEEAAAQAADLTPPADDGKGEVIAGETVPDPKAGNVSGSPKSKPKPDAKSGDAANGDPKRKAGDKGNASDNVKVGKGGKKTAGRKNKGGGTGSAS